MQLLLNLETTANYTTLQSPQLFVNGLFFSDKHFNNNFIRNTFNVGSNPPCKSNWFKSHYILWHSAWTLPYNYVISNKIK